MERIDDKDFSELGNSTEMNRDSKREAEANKKAALEWERHFKEWTDEELIETVTGDYFVNYICGVVSSRELISIRWGFWELESRGYGINFIKKPFNVCNNCGIVPLAIKEEGKMKSMRQDICPDCGEKPLIEQKEIPEIKKPTFSSNPGLKS